MLGSAVAQLSFASSVALGVPFARWALDHLVSAAVATQHEFGTIGSGATELVSRPALDEALRPTSCRYSWAHTSQRSKPSTMYCSWQLPPAWLRSGYRAVCARGMP